MKKRFVKKTLGVAGVGFGLLCLSVQNGPGQAAASEPEPLSYGDQVFRPGALWLDDKGVPINAHGGGMLFFDSRYYWFGEHKVEGEAGNKAQVGVHVYSSTNLYSWKDEGIALAVSPDPASEITQ